MTKAGKQTGMVQNRSLPMVSGRLASRAAALLVLALILGVGGMGMPRAHGQLIRWGPFGMEIGAYLELEYTDNVNSSEDDLEEDILLRVGPTLSGTIQLSPYLSGGQPLVLSIGLNLGFAWSLTGNRTDTFSSPVSLSIVLPVYIESWTFILSDTFSFTNDPLESSLGYGDSDIKSFSNIASINTSRQFGRLAWGLGVSRDDIWYPDTPDEDVTSHQFSVTPSYMLTRRYSVFWQNTYGIVDFAGPTRRDSTGWSSLVGVSGQLTRHVSGSASVGWSHSTLEPVNLPGNVSGEDNIDGLSSQVNLNFARPLRPNTVYSISLYRSPGVTAVMRDSDITEITGVTLQLAHRLSRTLTLSPTVSYEYLRDLGDKIPGVKQETAGIIRLGVGLDRVFTRKLNGYFRYIYQTRDSSLNGQSYDVNRVTFGLHYTF
ncbi:outer membrane beta-barrel protein [bacterium]|nr:outer membrane beta-barrel protein [bacterium]